MYFADKPATEIVTKKMVRVENPDSTFDQFDISKIPGWAPRAGYYPVELTGSGTMPDPSALTWDEAGQKWTGEYVPLPPSRKVTYLEFRKRIVDDGVSMGALFTAARSDGALEDFLTAAQNTSDRMIDLDDGDTVAGLSYIEAGGIGGATAGFADRVRA
jgi:hypothetical protein